MKHATFTLREANERLRVLSHRLLDGRESDRCSIVQNLRDEIGHAIPLITLNLCEIGKLPRHSNVAPREEQLADSFQILDQLLRHLRGLAADMKAHNP